MLCVIVCVLRKPLYDCAAAYGDRAKHITKIAEDEKLGKRLARAHPMLEAEIVYACRHEFCEHAEDFIARRTRLAFLDTAATEQALPRVRTPSLTSRNSGSDCCCLNKPHLLQPLHKPLILPPLGRRCALCGLQAGYCMCTRTGGYRLVSTNPLTNPNSSLYFVSY